MIAEFRLPDLGEGLPEAEIVQWLVARGDEVTLNQPIAEVETAKAIVELPSPFAGTVSDLHAAAGDVVAVGAPLIAIDVPGDAGAPAGAGGAGSADPAGVTRETAADTAETAADTDATVPNLVGYGAAPRTAGRPQRRARAVRAAAASASASDTAVLADAPHDVVASAPTEDLRHERPRSTPPVRAYAKERGVDLALVEASGVTGIIRREDVDRYADAMRAQAASASATAAPAAPGTPGARETRIPIRGVRKHTAAAMVQSAFTAPHVTTFLEVDVTETVRLVADLRADRRLDGHRIGILAVAAKAVCLALRAEPSLNARWDGPAGEIVQFHYVNLGIAAATERGLVVPHIADADRLTLVELADAIGALAQTARSGRTAPGALSGGTFSITNFGVFGIDAGTPILNPGEAGILGLGSVRRRPWEHDGQIVLRDIVTLSLSFDHRLADGQEASRFLRAVGDVLREPGRAMLLS
ncbi:MAG: 2-oxo acid dehydrogenase subunit E2 [Microbacterium hominis]|uniref:dihydrolipoamide acetyltransferase family protein n=1 Tax=Microbacterium aurum TaxID=36805 RepID=UPI00248D47FC|nr:dihydrolipoamide acetyltransferase family protein [Microbacterium aurum]MBZ6372199.1 2-oxo acid dehydrogenase subunit E2 [Microbacterium hominis]